MSDDPKNNDEKKAQAHVPEEPSFVRKAQSTFTAHQAHIEKHGVPDDSPPIEAEYQPKWENQIEFDAAALQNSVQGADHFDRLIDQIIHQQKGKQAAEQERSLLWRQRARIVQGGLVIVVVGVFSWMYFQKQSADEARQNRQRLISGDSRTLTRDKLQEIFRDEKDLIKAHLESGYTPPKAGGGSRSAASMAAKLVTTLRVAPDRFGVECTAGLFDELAVVGLSHSRLSQLADDLAVYQWGNYLYIFTPYYAAKQEIYEGFFWEKKWHDVISKFGGDYRSKFPQQSLAVPYNAMIGLHDIGGYFYLDSQRGLPLSREAPFVFGSLREDVSQLTLSPLDVAKVMWPASGEKSRLDPQAAAIVQNEVLNQVQRFRQNRMQPFFRQSSDINRLEKSGISEVLTACRQAARAYKLPALEEVAKTELRRLTKFRSYRGRYVFKARGSKGDPRS